MKHWQIIFILLTITSCTFSKNTKNVIVSVNSGDSINKVVHRLHKYNIITHPLVFKIIAKVLKQESALKIGTYSIPPHTSYPKLLNILNSGIDIGQFVTIPEGFNIFQIAALLQQKNVLSAKEFLQEVYNSSFFEKFGIPANDPYTISELKTLHDKNGYIFIIPNTPPTYSLEGYLFPDTYNFPKYLSAKQVIQIFINRFNQIIDPSIQEQIKAQHKTLHEIIIMASIIEKEAANKSEMSVISGVFYNRLRERMRLQASPALIYALILSGEYKGNITKAHLKPPWPSPYNTDYVNRLPAGPIANPGKSAILAAIHPAKHNFLYFCRNAEGNHTFTKTLNEHNTVVFRWRKHKKNINNRPSHD